MFFPPWADSSWIFKLSCSSKVESHEVHLNGFFFSSWCSWIVSRIELSWEISMWFSKFVLLKNASVQSLHLYLKNDSSISESKVELLLIFPCSSLTWMLKLVSDILSDSELETELFTTSWFSNCLWIVLIFTISSCILWEIKMWYSKFSLFENSSAQSVQIYIFSARDFDLLCLFVVKCFFNALIEELESLHLHFRHLTWPGSSVNISKWLQILLFSLFFPPWADSEWIFKLSFSSKVDSHEVHLNGFFFSSWCSWTTSTCLVNWSPWEKLSSHLEHLWGFFSSWIVSKCFNKITFWEKLFWHNEHLNGFFPSWMDFVWIFELSLSPKVESREVHLNGFFFTSWCSWTTSTCLVNWPPWEKLSSHLEHLWNFPSWIVSICFFKISFWEKLFWQNEHLNGFFPSWTDSVWIFKLSLSSKVESHDIHLNGFFFSSWCSWIVSTLSFCTIFKCFCVDKCFFRVFKE